MKLPARKNNLFCPRHIRGLAGLACLVFCLAAPGTIPARAQTSAPQSAAPLTDQPLAREMQGAARHSFQIPLTKGQFLLISADQRGIDIEISIADPRGQTVAEMDTPNGLQGPEAAGVIADTTGDYRIDIVSTDKDTPRGQYEIRLAARRPATDQDRHWIAAQQNYGEGQRLRRQDTNESRLLAVGKYQEASRHWQAAGDPNMQAHALLCAGLAFQRAGQLQNSLDPYQQGLALMETQKDPREIVVFLSQLGLVSNNLGNPGKALEYYERALTLYQANGDNPGAAATLGNIGVVWRSRGELGKALEHYNKALPFWQNAGNRPRQAVTLHNIGSVHEAAGEFQNALGHYLRALAMHRAVGDRNSEGGELNSIGFVNSQLGEWPKALEYYQQALAIWTAGADRLNEATTRNNLGVAWVSQGQPDKAREQYQLALRISREVGSRGAEAAALENLGDLYVAAADHEKALDHYQQALQLRKNSINRLGEAKALNNLGFLYIARRDPAQALACLQQALTLTQSLTDRRGEARARHGLAIIERDRNNLGEARRQIESAIALVESVRSDAGSQQLRASFLASAQKYYEFQVDTLMRLHAAGPAAPPPPGGSWAAVALEASERARARSLLEMLSELRANIREGADKTLLEREHELVRLLNAKAARQLQLRVQTGAQRGSETQLREISQDISALEDEYQQLQARLRQNNPRYSALTQPQTLGLADIQRLLDADSLLLEFATGDERSYLWTVTQDALSSYELPARRQLETAARQVYELLTARAKRVPGESATARATRIARADTQLSAAAAQLSGMLFSPIAGRLHTEWAGKRLIIVADGALQYVPFGMLPSPKDDGGRITDEAENKRLLQPSSFILHPLIADHEIITLPSASTLAVQRRELAGRVAAPRALAVFADPVFSAGDARARRGAGVRQTGVQTGDGLAASRIIDHESGKITSMIGGGLLIPRLPYTRLEADRILALVPRDKGFRATGYGASRAQALSADLAQYRYLHFATHGYLDSERPDLSALVLSMIDEKGRPQDGFLRTHEIYNMNLPAELVVLSACQTGLGREVRGEGLVGLTRGFMYAGAARVVVSLWNVNDRATAELMTRFYQRMLRHGQTPAAALRAAQVEMWKQKQWAAAYYWAAFVLQGEWR
ncbi:MAG: CHAT domain-containing tetratricopeptide repeat protein [Blastocatellia bacterium]